MGDVNQFRQALKADDGDIVQLNKGHFSLDTEDRAKEFDRKMSYDWPDRYREYRANWEKLPAEKRVNKYPLLVDVELASSCNLKCPMCYTTTDHFKEVVSRKIMSWELYQKVVDEICEDVPALRLSWRGESTLHPRFIEAVRYAKEKGIGEVSFLTNGSKLELEYFIELAEAGADWITISFDGIGEEYNKIRAPLKYEETLAKLHAAMEYKAQKGLLKPLIKVQGVWPAIKKGPEEFYKTMKEVSDLVAFNPLIDYLSSDDESQIVYEDNFSCPQLYQRLFVSSTGECMMCNSDEYGEEIVGNANETSIFEIWHGEPLERIRALHGKHNGFMDVGICKKCFYPRKTEVSEVVNIEGREVMVENYINRAQSVGQ